MNEILRKLSSEINKLQTEKAELQNLCLLLAPALRYALLDKQDDRMRSVIKDAQELFESKKHIINS